MRIILFFALVNFAFSHSSKTVTNKGQSLLREIYKSAPFIPNNDPDKFFGRYLVKNINFKPIEKIRTYIESKRGVSLKHRGEAHITVVTPPEFNTIKKWNPDFEMDDVHELVRPLIQLINFRILGIGSLEGKNSNNQFSQVFFLIVESRGLRALRKLIAAEWQIPKIIFNPEDQDFHITIGFTVSDLFAQPNFPARKEISSLQFDLDLYSIE